MRCLLVGTGDMAHALARQYTKTCKDNTFHTLSVASPTRYVASDSFFHGFAPFVDLIPALQSAHVVILAISGSALPSFLETYKEYLKTNEKLVIDVSNEAFNHNIFDQYGSIRWIKGLNDVGAIDLLGRKGKSKPTTVLSGRDASSVQEAKTFIDTAFGFDVTMVEHSYRQPSEQDSLGKEWAHALYIALFLYTTFLAVITVHYYVRWPYPYGNHKWPVTTQNKIVSCVAVSLFALSVMPGTVARMVRTYQNDSMYVLHPALCWALGIRKHLGLLGLYFLSVHAIMSLIDFSPGSYYWWAYDSITAPSMNLTGEVSMMFAVYSTTLFIIVGLCSLPCVGDGMTKAQWNFVFGPVVWTALAFGHVHYCVIYFRVIRGSFKANGSIPHATLLGSLLPWLAFALKFVQIGVSVLMPIMRKMCCCCYGKESNRPAVHKGFPSKANTQYYTGKGSLSTTEHPPDGSE